MNKEIHLSDHFSYSRLLKYVLSPILMMIFTSIYSIVDGFVVSNYVGETPFAALNLVYPILMALGAIGFMFGTGGSALVSKTLGEKDNVKANKYFSMIVYFTIIVGIVMSIIAFIFMPDIAYLLNARGEMLENAVLYGRMLVISLIFFMLQNMFQSFFVVNETAKLGFIVIVIAGVTNMILDTLFVVILDLKLFGAALATCISQVIGGTIPLIYFIFNKKSLIKLVPTSFEFKPLFKAATNGSSEFLSNVSASFVSVLFNYKLLDLSGEHGVSAYGVMMYVQFVFIAVFLGYSIGVSPIIGYNYGAKNVKELKNIFKKSLILMGVFGFTMFSLIELLSPVICNLFVGYNKELYDITLRGLVISSFVFLVCGFNIFASSLFTSLNNGLISAILSFSRVMIFQFLSVLILPEILKIEGIWLSIVVSDAFAFITSIIFILAYRKRYKYA